MEDVYEYQGYDEYQALTPADSEAAGANPPSNSWWQNIAGNVISTAGGVLAAREAAKRNANGNPPPGGAGLNPQASTVPGAAMVRAIPGGSMSMVVVGAALFALLAAWLIAKR